MQANVCLVCFDDTDEKIVCKGCYEKFAKDIEMFKATLDKFADKNIRMWRGQTEITFFRFVTIRLARAQSVQRGKYIVLEDITVQKNIRKRGLANVVLDILETKLKELGFGVFVVQAIESRVMYEMVKKRGYRHDEMTFMAGETEEGSGRGMWGDWVKEL